MGPLSVKCLRAGSVYINTRRTSFSVALHHIRCKMQIRNDDGSRPTSARNVIKHFCLKQNENGRKREKKRGRERKKRKKKKKTKANQTENKTAVGNWLRIL